MPVSVAQLMVNVGADVNPATAKLGGLVGMLGGPLGLAAAGAAAAVVGVGIASVKMAGNFQQGITTLVTGAGEAQSNIGLISQGILNLATATGTSTQQLISGAFMVESAGYHGAAGLNVLKAAAEGAKVGGADLGSVADAATTILKDFGKTGITASQAVNELIATVSSGKTHLEDLAGAMAQILPTAAAAHIGLQDVMGAMATMTGEGVPAANAATYLRQTLLALDAPSAGTVKALAAVGLKSSAVAAELQKSLPGALAMITTAIGKKFPEGSAGYVAALKAVAGGSKQMQGILDLTGAHAADFAANVKNIAGQVKKGGDSIVGWTQVQGDFNQQMSRAKEVVETLMIKLGTGLLPVLTQLAKGFADHLPGVVKLLTGHLSDLTPVLVGVGAAIAAAVIPALWGMVAALVPIVGTALAAAAPFIALGAAVAGAVVIFKHFYDTSAPFRQVITGLVSGVTQLATVFQSHLQQGLQSVLPHLQQVAQWLGGALPQAAQAVAGFLSGPLATGFHALANAAQLVWTFLQPLAQTLGAQVRPILATLAQTLTQSLAPAWASLQSALASLWPILASLGQLIALQVVPAWNMMKPALLFIGEIIGGTLLVTIGLLIGVLNGLFAALGQVLQGAIKFAGGLIQAIAGALQVVTSVVEGVLAIIVDIFTGNWSKIGADATKMWNGIVAGVTNIVKGLWIAIQGIFQAGVGGIVALVKGFIGGVIGYFTTLWDKLTGHSIIPDMVNDIVSWFKQLPGRALSAVQGLASDLTGFFGGLATTALGWGANLLHGFVAGIQGQIGNLRNVASAVVSNVASFLGFHSPAKEGPGSDADTWAPSLMQMYAQGLAANAPALAAAAGQAMRGVQAALGADMTGHLSLTASGESGGLALGPTPAITSLGVGPSVQQAQANAALIAALTGSPNRPIQLILDGRAVAQGMLPHLTQQIRLSTGIRSQ